MELAPNVKGRALRKVTGKDKADMITRTCKDYHQKKLISSRKYSEEIAHKQLYCRKSLLLMIMYIE